MKKAAKQIGKILRKALFFLILLVLLVSGVVHSCWFQTIAGKFAGDFCTEWTGNKVHIGKLEFSLFQKAVTMRGLLIEDGRGQAVLRVSTAHARLNSYDFSNLDIASAYLDRPLVRIVKYKEDSMSDFMKIIKKFESQETDTLEGNAARIRKVYLKEGSFIYDNESRPKAEAGLIDFRHVHVSKFTANVSSLLFYRGGVYGEIVSLDALEKSGFDLRQFRTSVAVLPDTMIIRNMEIKTPRTHLIGNVSFGYDDFMSFVYFAKKMHLLVDLEPGSYACFKDIAYYVSAFKGDGTTISLSGSLDGNRSEWTAQQLKVKYGEKTFLDLDLQWNNFPRFKEGIFALDIREIYALKSDVQKLERVRKEKWKFPMVLNALEYISVRGTFGGNLEKFNTNVEVGSNLGQVLVDIGAVDTLNRQKYFEGTVQTKQLNVGRLLGIDNWLGTTNADLHLSAIGYDFAGMQYTLQGRLTDFNFRQNTIDRIDLDCQTHKNYFHGNVACVDPDVRFVLDGLFDYEQEEPISRYELNIEYADLQAIGLVNDTSSFEVGGQFFSNYMGRDWNDLLGNFRIENLFAKRLGAEFNMPQMTISSRKINSDLKRTEIESDFLSLVLEGRYEITQFAEIIPCILADYVPGIRDSSGERLMEIDVDRKKDQDFTLNIALHPFTDPVNGQPSGVNRLLNLFVPELQVDEKLQMSMVYRAPMHYYDIQLGVAHVIFNGMALVNGKLRIATQGDELLTSLRTERLYLRDSVYMSNFGMSAVFNGKDVVFWDLAWKNHGDSTLDEKVSGSIKGRLDFSKPESILVGLDSSVFFFAGKQWLSFPEAHVCWGKDGVNIYDMGIYAPIEKESIQINGEWSADTNAELTLLFKDFDISYLDFIVRKSGMEVDADISGTVRLKDPTHTFSFGSDIQLSSLYINGTSYGEARISAQFDREKENVDAQLWIGRNELGRTPYLWGEGTYRIKQKSLDFDARLSSLPVAFLAGYLESFASNLTGSLNGKVHLGGDLKDLKIKGEVKSDSLALTVNMLQTRYMFDKLKLRISSSELVFEEAQFTDMVYGTSGSLHGKITHELFDDMALNTQINFKKLLLLNTQPSKDAMYSGRVFATGQVKLRGPLASLYIGLQGKVEKDSYIKFNLASSSATQAKFLTFVKPKDTQAQGFVYSRKKQQEQDMAKSKLTLDLALEVTPDIELGLDLHNAAMNGLLMANGAGTMRLLLNETGTQLFGMFKISKGHFDLSMIDVINKRFTLKEGGTLTWTGPMAEARMDVSAAYNTRTSLYPILASSGAAEMDESGMKKKVAVESIINLGGKVSNPDVHFDIKLLNVDANLGDIFASYVNKDNEDEMIKQTFSLLMFNTFVATGGNGAEPSSNNALISSSEVLFNQLNGLLSKMSKNFDLGMNYTPGDANNSSEFQVMMSGRLFDDRLTINGNLAVSEADKATAKSASNVVGDISVEWKFTEQLGVRAFNRSNEKDLTTPENSYTQGVGVVFRRDFNTAKELFSRMGPSKAERREIREGKKKLREGKSQKKTEKKQAKQAAKKD